MALHHTTDIWRDIILMLTSYQDVLTLVGSHPSFVCILQDHVYLRQWLNMATPKVKYEFGDVGGPYAYGDWTFDHIMRASNRGTLRYYIESILAGGCNASVLRNGKPERCGQRGGFCARDEVTFSFDLLRDHGWKICKACLSKVIISLEDQDSLAYLSTFTKVFPAAEPDRMHSIPVRMYRHLGKQHLYYKMSEVDQFVLEESSGLFISFSVWRAGVIAKRGSTSELQISALLHSARGLALPGGPGRTLIAFEIAQQTIKEYEHRMNQFVLANHPDLHRLRLTAAASGVLADSI